MKMGPSALISQLMEQSGWVDAKTLATILHVTPRTIRSYVRRLNEESNEIIIESSSRGYRLVNNEFGIQTRPKSSTSTSADSRAERLIRILLATDRPQSIYDMADELHVSESTMQLVLRKARKIVQPYKLVISRAHDSLVLMGSESDKRRFINRILIGSRNMDFSALTNSTVLKNGYDVHKLKYAITDALAEHGLTCDDYGLNNMVMHLAIMLSRIEAQQRMTAEEAPTTGNASPEVMCATEVCMAMGESLGISIDDPDRFYFALVIEANTRRATTAGIMTSGNAPVFEERDLSIAEHAAERVSTTYCLERFSTEFIQQLAVHIHALISRAATNTFVYNPLVNKVRSEYPLIHDMAVVMADAISREASIRLTEDEIAFFTFHIGGYLQNRCMIDRDCVTCVVLYINYHNMQDYFIQRLRSLFKTQLQIISVQSVFDYDSTRLDCELILSPLEVDVPEGCRRVVISPLFGREDEEAVRKAVNEISQEKRGRQLESTIAQFLRPDFFKLNFYPGNYDELIAAMVLDCLDKGLVGEGYLEKVLEREALSPTVFDNLVAVPHTVEPAALRSFLYLVINDRPVAWGQSSANIILLLGISENDRESFTNFYSDFLSILSNAKNASELIGSVSYEDFMRRLTALLKVRHD